MCALSQKQPFCEHNKLIRKGLHEILGVVPQPPRQGMRSSTDSLDKKRFIGEHRGEFKAKEWEGRGALQLGALLR